MKKLLYTLVATCLFTLTVETFAQPGRKPDGPGFQPQGGPAHPGAPKPTVHPTPAPKPTVHPTPAPAPKPAVHPTPAPAPKPVVQPAPGPKPPVQPGPAPHHHDAPKPPHPDYRPGFKSYSLQRPFEHDYYRDWLRPTYNQYFTFVSVPDKVQIHLWPGQKFEIKLEEERREGFSWFARYDAYYVDVDIDHKKGHRTFFGHRERYAEIEIKGKHQGASMVELIYANRYGWDNGDAPVKVIQLFVFTE